MDEQTTTDAPVQEQATTESQPEEQHAEAVYTDNSESTTTNADEQSQQTQSQEPGTPDNSTDDKVATDEWLRSKGLDPNDPQAFQKAANMAYNSEKLMSRTQAKSVELEKQLKDIPYEQVSSDPIAQQALERAASVELAMNVQNWKQANNVTDEQDAAIAKYITDNQDKAVLLKNGYLTLDDVAAMSGAFKQDSNAIKQQGSRETLEKLATKQQASSLPSSASTGPAPSALTADNAEAWWDSLGPQGRADPENIAKLDAVLG